MATPPLRIALAVLAVVPGSPALADLAGTWLHVGDPTGRMISHLEELVLAEDSAAPQGSPYEIRVHRVEAQTAPACLQGPASPEACSAVVVANRGRMVLEPGSGRLQITETETLAQPFSHPVDQAGWALLSLSSGQDWTLTGDSGGLALLREIPVTDLPDGSPDGQPLMVEKRFHPVPQGFAGDLLTVAVDLGTQPLVLAGCVVEALVAQPETLAAVAEEIALAVPVIRQIRAIQAAQGVLPRSLTRGMMENTVLPFLQQTGDDGLPVRPAPGFAPEAWEAAIALARFHRTDPVAASVLFPEALPMVGQIGACQDRLRG